MCSEATLSSRSLLLLVLSGVCALIILTALPAPRSSSGSDALSGRVSDGGQLSAAQLASLRGALAAVLPAALASALPAVLASAQAAAGAAAPAPAPPAATLEPAGDASPPAASPAGVPEPKRESSSTPDIAAAVAQCAAAAAAGAGGSGPRMKIVPGRVTSQGDQDGIISSIFAAIGTTNKYFAEFGFNSDDWLSGSGANSYQLHVAGWKGLLLDGGHENATMNLHKHWMLPHTMPALFDQYAVPRALDYLSVDTDSVDLWMLRALLAAGYRPRLISIEYNANYAIDECITEGWWTTNSYSSLHVFGASLKAIAALGDEFGYAVVAVVLGNDVFLVPCEVLAKGGFATPALAEFTADTCFPVHEAVPADGRAVVLPDVIDFCAWRRTGDRHAAVAAAEVVVTRQPRPANCPVIVYRRQR